MKNHLFFPGEITKKLICIDNIQKTSFSESLVQCQQGTQICWFLLLFFFLFFNKYRSLQFSRRRWFFLLRNQQYGIIIFWALVFIDRKSSVSWVSDVAHEHLVLIVLCVVCIGFVHIFILLSSFTFHRLLQKQWANFNQAWVHKRIQVWGSHPSSRGDKITWILFFFENVRGSKNYIKHKLFPKLVYYKLLIILVIPCNNLLLTKGGHDHFKYFNKLTSPFPVVIWT